MIEQPIFEDSFFIPDVMCYKNCGRTVRNALSNTWSDLKKQLEPGLLPDDAMLYIDVTPLTLGINRYEVRLSSRQSAQLTVALRTHLVEHLRKGVSDIGFDVFDTVDAQGGRQEHNFISVNWINIAVNILALIAIITLSILLPPSLPLTIGLTALCFFTTAFTARDYFIDFFRNLREGNLLTMSTSIVFAWALSLTHTIYHSVTMGLIFDFAMTFMNFMMPVMLITVVNIMDEVKRIILDKSKLLYFKGMQSLFPRMKEKYSCYQLDEHELTHLSQLIPSLSEDGLETATEDLDLRDFDGSILTNANLIDCPKAILNRGFIIDIPPDACFPVNGYLIDGETAVDASILNGEPWQLRKKGQFVPGGAINLQQPVKLYATQDVYNSRVNQMILSANRSIPKKPKNAAKNEHFTYLYMALIVVAIIAAVVIPAVLGSFSIPLMLQAITGILFAICPCTIAIAHQLPTLLNQYFLQTKRHVFLRHSDLLDRTSDIHTFVFDKTGTLTTGHSKTSSIGITAAVWQRLYLLESRAGMGHPLAKAICDHCRENKWDQSQFTDIRPLKDAQNRDMPIRDPKSRGLSAYVQEKKIQVGSEAYLKAVGVHLPQPSDFILNQLNLGCTLVYVAEEEVYQGVILIKHQISPNTVSALRRWKRDGVKLILSTGAGELSANGFNQLLTQKAGEVLFAPENIKVDQEPEDKKAFLDALFDKEKDASGICFIGDGYNDAPGFRLTSARGGLSCAMTETDKTAFFADMSLGGSFDYLFAQTKLNRFSKKIMTENQWLLAYGALAFLAFAIGLPCVGIGFSPLIPVIVMVSTTVVILLNSYRAGFAVETGLDPTSSWIKRYLTSDLSLGIFIGGSALLITSILIFSLTAGCLGLPAFVFTASVPLAVSSVCLLVATVMLGGLFCLIGASIIESLFLSSEQTPLSANEADWFDDTLQVTSVDVHPDESCKAPLNFLFDYTRPSTCETNDKTDEFFCEPQSSFGANIGKDARHPEHSEGSPESWEMSRAARHDVRLWEHANIVKQDLNKAPVSTINAQYSP